MTVLERLDDLDVAAPPTGERAKLRRELGRLDTIFFLISAMVVVDTIGAVAIGGPQAFTWLGVLFVTFFIPSALASAELGAALPEEGGAYVWVREAFGRFAGSLSSLLYWAGTPMWLGGSVAAVALTVHQRFIGELSMTGRYAFGITFVVLATVAAVVPLRYGKWVPTSGAIGQIALLSLFTLSVVLYGIRHGVHGISVGDLSPSTGVLIAVVPVLIYSFVGVELPSAAAEEMVDPRRDVPVAIARAGVAQALMYGIPILAVLVVLPARSITSLHGLIDAMRTVFTVYGGSVDAQGVATLTGAGQILGWICAVTFIWVLLASGSAWIIGAGRAQAAACLDGGGPPGARSHLVADGGAGPHGARLRGRRAGRRSWPASTSRGATTRSTSPPRSRPPSRSSSSPTCSSTPRSWSCGSAGRTCPDRSGLRAAGRAPSPSPCSPPGGR